MKNPSSISLHFGQNSPHQKRNKAKRLYVAIQMIWQRVLSRAEPATNLADLAFKVRDRKTGERLVIHLEPQEALKNPKEFPSRMFVYFSRLYEEYRHPVFPIVVFTSKKLVKPQPGTFEMKCFNGKRHVIQFKYEVIQLSRLSWKEYAARPNPIAVAFAAKMIVAPGEGVA